MSSGECTNVASARLKFRMGLWLMFSLRASNQFGKCLSIKKVDAGILGLIRDMQTRFGRTCFLALLGSSLIAAMKSRESCYPSLKNRIRLVFGWSMEMKVISKKEWNKTLSRCVSCPQKSVSTLYFFSNQWKNKRKRST